MAKNNLNPLTDTPDTLTPLTKDFMLEYVKVKGTEEDKEWYKKVCNSNIVKKKNNFTGQETDGVDYKVVRHEFAKRFFPHLLKPQKKGVSYLDLVNEL